MQVSHSRVDTFKKCPYQFKLHYVDGLETYFNGDPANPLIIGTALHTGIEKDTETAIKEYYANYPVINDKNIEEAIKLEAVIKKCVEALPPLNDALFETKIECPEFIGFIDLLVPVKPPKKVKVSDGENIYMECEVADADKYEWFDMYDFKYSNNVKNYMESGQLHEYKFYFEKLNPTKRIKNMYFLFAPKVAIRQKYKNKTNKRDETLEEFRRRIDQELQNKDAQLVKISYKPDKVKDFLRSAKECREATTYQKQPSRLCDWCEFQKYCEDGEEIDLMNLPKNERRTVTSIDNKKIWLYGAPFSGKTYLANEFPDPIMLNTDGNIKYVDAPYVAIKDIVTQEGRITKRTFAWQVFKDTIAELEKKQNDFKTIVVDLLEDTYEYCRLYMYDQLGISHESDDSFRAWDKVRTEFLSTIKRLMNLDYENIILISHEDTSKDLTKKSGDKVSAIKPNIQDKAALKIAGMIDLVARVIDDEGNRILSFKTNEVIFGGGRLNLTVSEIPCDYDELCKVYEDASAGKKVEKVEEKPKARKTKASNKTAAAEPDKETTGNTESELRIVDGEEDESTEVETADAPPFEVETADEPPKRKTRTRTRKTDDPEEVAKEVEKVAEAIESAEAVETTVVEEESPKRRRRRKTE